ncbi:MAG: ubiquitin-like small modifier protein 1 [Candidatus Bathyarchaeia archaeon]
MKVTVKFFTTLREIVGKPQEQIELPEAVTVNELLQQLGKEYGEKFSRYVYDEKGAVRGHLHFLINGKSVTTQQGLKTKLKENDILAILPPVGGG